MPTYAMQEESLAIIDLLITAKISSSKREARQDLQNGSIYINGERCTDLERNLGPKDGLHGKYLIIRRGKKKYTLVK